MSELIMEVKGNSGLLEIDCPRFITPKESYTIQEVEDIFEDRAKRCRDKDERKQLKEVVNTLRLARINSAELEAFRYNLKFQAILSFETVFIMKKCQQAIKPQFTSHTAIVSIPMPDLIVKNYKTTEEAEMWFSFRRTATTNDEQKLTYRRGEVLFEQATKKHATIERIDHIAGVLKVIFSFKDSSERDSFVETVEGAVAEAKINKPKPI